MRDAKGVTDCPYIKDKLEFWDPVVCSNGGIVTDTERDAFKTQWRAGLDASGRDEWLACAAVAEKQEDFSGYWKMLLAPDDGDAICEGFNLCFSSPTTESCPAETACQELLGLNCKFAEGGSGGVIGAIVGAILLVCCLLFYANGWLCFAKEETNEAYRVDDAGEGDHEEGNKGKKDSHGHGHNH